jgi:hypothetical protein
MGGYVTDPSGAVIANARITITASANGGNRNTTSDAGGRWLTAGMPSGNLTAKVEMPGFKTGIFSLNYDANQPSMYNFPLSVASASETVEVTAQAAQIQTEARFHGNAIERLGMAQNGASVNVINLQRRMAGVLPVAIDVPRAGTSFAFVRPLVLDEETKVTFSYKSR